MLESLKKTDKRAANIVSIDSFVSDVEMLCAIKSCDAVATLYPGHIGSASIVIRAAAMKKPVIGTNFGWIGYVVQKYGLGYSFDVQNESALVDGIDWCFTKARMDLNKAEDFVSQHTVAGFSNAILSQC